MPPTQSDEANDSFAVGVKDLFESYEDALLPVDVQLQKFKRRDLYTSHFHRTSCKVFGPRKHVRKVHLVDVNPFEEQPALETPELDIVLPSYYSKSQPLLKPLEVKGALPVCSVIDKHKSWVEERKKLRSNLDQLGLTASWLERKPQRTVLEECVLNRLHKDKGKEWYLTAETSQRILRILPLNIRCSLKKLCKCMKDHDVSLEDVFPSFDFSKTASVDVYWDGLNTLVQMETINKSEADEIIAYFSANTHHSLYHLLHLLLKGTHISSEVPSSTDEKSLGISASSEKAGDKQNHRRQEYNAALQMCKEKGVVLNEALLEKALLIPDDFPRRSTLQTKIRQLGECLPKDFWKAQHKSNVRRKMSIYRAHRKAPKDSGDSVSLFSTASDLSLSTAASDQTTDLANQSPSTLTSSNADTQKESSSDTLTSTVFSEVVSCMNTNDSMMSHNSSTDSDSDFAGNSDIVVDCSGAISNCQSSNRLKEKGTLPKLLAVTQQLLKSKKRKTSPSLISESQSSGRRTPNEPNLVTFPRLRDVAPERHQMNLSTGRATISRKVDCWLTFEEYEKLTSSTEPMLWRERAIPNAFWPGHLLDKLRLCMCPCDTHPLPKCDPARSKNTVFHNVRQVPHNGRRSNYGYDNNELTWPNDGKYIKYGSVDQDKVYRL